jgi:glutamate synthase (NADPH/NADH) large chain
VYDVAGELGERCNFELVDLESLTPDDDTLVHALVNEHLERTGSPVALRLLRDWEHQRVRFIKVMPRAYKQVLTELAARAAAASSPASEPIRVAAAPLKASA